MEFVVPLHPEDLEQQKPGRLYVHAVLDVENCQNVDQVIDGWCSRAGDLGMDAHASV